MRRCQHAHGGGIVPGSNSLASADLNGDGIIKWEEVAIGLFRPVLWSASVLLLHAAIALRSVARRASSNQATEPLESC